MAPGAETILARAAVAPVHGKESADAQARAEAPGRTRSSAGGTSTTRSSVGETISTPTQRFSALQPQLLASALHFFHRHIRTDMDVLNRMEGNSVFRDFYEVQYHYNKPTPVNQVFLDSVYDTSTLHVCSFILSILHQGIFSVSAFIVAVIYLSRFKENTHITLHATTWRPLFLAALLVADKVWEDKPVRNSSLARLFPVLVPAELNRLEARLLRETRFHVLVKPELFTSFCEKLLTEPVHPEIWQCVQQSEYTASLNQGAKAEPKKAPPKEQQAAAMPGNHLLAGRHPAQAGLAPRAQGLPYGAQMHGRASGGRPSSVPAAPPGAAQRESSQPHAHVGPHAVRANPSQAGPQLGWPRTGGLVRDRPAPAAVPAEAHASRSKSAGPGPVPRKALGPPRSSSRPAVPGAVRDSRAAAPSPAPGRAKDPKPQRVSEGGQSSGGSGNARAQSPAQQPVPNVASPGMQPGVHGTAAPRMQSPGMRGLQYPGAVQSPVPAGGLGQVLAPPPSTRAPGAFASPMLYPMSPHLRTASPHQPGPYQFQAQPRQNVMPGAMAGAPQQRGRSPAPAPGVPAGTAFPLHSSSRGAIQAVGSPARAGVDQRMSLGAVRGVSPAMGFTGRPSIG